MGLVSVTLRFWEDADVRVFCFEVSDERISMWFRYGIERIAAAPERFRSG